MLYRPFMLSFRENRDTPVHLELDMSATNMVELQKFAFSTKGRPRIRSKFPFSYREFDKKIEPFQSVKFEAIVDNNVVDEIDFYLGHKYIFPIPMNNGEIFEKTFYPVLQMVKQRHDKRFVFVPFGDNVELMLPIPNAPDAGFSKVNFTMISWPVEFNIPDMYKRKA